MRHHTATRRHHGAALVLLVAVLVGGHPGPASSDAGPVGGGSRAHGPNAGCAAVDEPFTPTSARIAGVVGTTRVLALGRDRNGVPRTPPLTDRGKWQLGWDRRSGIRPGSPRGVVRLTAHTYPRSGTYGLALGNRLLSELRKDTTIRLEGRAGERLCYVVTQVRRVRAGQSVPAYYTSTGRPRLAILVCSGVRRGPGDWSHRTIWFADPL